MMKKWMLLLLVGITCSHGWGQMDPFLSGRASMMKGDFQSALIQMKLALEEHPGETEILYQLGICHFTLNSIPAARDAFYEVEKRRKGRGSLYLARCEVKLGHPELAMKYLKEHLSSGFKVPEKEILLDKDLSSLEASSEWQQLWNEKEWYSPGDKAFQEAQFLKETGATLEAINILNKLEKQGYEKSKVQTEKAALYAILGNPKAARSELRSATKSDVRNLDALYYLAACQLEEGESEEALLGLNRVIRQEPDRFEAYLLRADARSSQDDLPGAEKDIDIYLSYFPNDHKAHYQKGIIQYEHGKYLSAIQSFNSALGMNKGKAEYYFARGRTYASTGTIRYAEKDLSMALDLDPYNGEIWFEKGKLSLLLGKQSEACFCYRKAYQYGIFEAGELIDKQCK